MLKNNFLASNSVYVCTEHSSNIIEEYAYYLEKIFNTIKECEEGRKIDELLESPIAQSGFQRLN